MLIFNRNLFFNRSLSVDNCLIKTLLTCVNIKLFHTWIPDRSHLILKLFNCENVMQLIFSKYIYKFNFPDQIYIRDFLSKNMINGVTPAGIKSLDQLFGDSGSALIYSYGHFNVILKFRGQILAIQSNRLLRPNPTILFSKISLKGNEIYFDQEFKEVTKDGKTHSIVEFM